MITEFLQSLVSPVTNLASKLILDKDKYAELQFKKTDNEHEARMALLSTTTTPKIDALVKVLLALRDVVIPVFRPLGAVLMAAFGAYCAVEGIELPEYVQVALFGAPIGWGYSRHKTKQKDVESYTWEEDY